MTIAISAVYGLLIGSFLSVVVDRVPRGASIISPGSACGTCGLRLGVPDLIPVFSWLALRGRCSACKTPIAWRYPAVELTTAGLFAAAAAQFGAQPATLLWCAALALLLLFSELALARAMRSHT